MNFLDNRIIRIGGGFSVTIFRINRFIQMMALIICIVSLTFLFYQSSYGINVIEVNELNEKLENTIINNNIDAYGTQTQRNNDQIDYEQNEYNELSTINNENNVIVRSGNHREQVRDYLQRRRLYEYSVTATPKPATTNLNDIFISVKTTKIYHDTRLDIIIKTWFQLAPDQVSGNIYVSVFFACFC